MIKAVIFDLDGTLIDSMGVWDKIVDDFLILRQIAVPEGISMEIKNLSFQQSAEYFINRFTLSETSSQLIDIWNEMAFREYTENIQLKDGVKEFLNRLQQEQIKMGIATATDRQLVEAVLKRYKILDLFQVIVTVGEVGAGKEKSDIFLRAAGGLDVKPDECIVFEDCLHAVKSAKTAGMKVWAVYDRFSAHEKPELELIADRYIDSFQVISEGGLWE